LKDRAHLGGDRHNPNRVSVVVGRLWASHGHAALVTKNVAPPQSRQNGPDTLDGDVVRASMPFPAAPIGARRRRPSTASALFRSGRVKRST
jgi:hypothetical protein